MIDGFETFVVILRADNRVAKVHDPWHWPMGRKHLDPMAHDGAKERLP
jgi:hypothetical protein